MLGHVRSSSKCLTQGPYQRHSVTGCITFSCTCSGNLSEVVIGGRDKYELFQINLGSLSHSLLMNRSYGVLRVSAFFLRPHFFPLAVMRREERSKDLFQVLQWFINISLNMKLSKPLVAITYLSSFRSKLRSLA